MATATTSGREARRTSDVASAHTPDLTAFYKYSLPPITPGDFSFNVDLLRQGLPDLSLDTMTESLEWVDEASALTGTLTIYRPDAMDPTTPAITRGDEIRCRCTWQNALYDLWTMRCDAPQDEIDQGTVTVTLADDLILLDANDLDWIFRKTKQRPYGYDANEITRLVAQRLGLPCGQIVPATVKQTLIKRHASGKDVITAAWRKEFQTTGRSYILRLRNGAVEVVNITRNPMLYVLGPQIQTALLVQKGGAKRPTTVLTGMGRLGHGTDTQKITYTLYDRSVVNALGYVPATKHYGQVGSHSELRDLVTRDLAKAIRLPDNITIDHAGIPFILRGDGVQIDLPTEGYSGQNAFVYTVSGDHTVSDGQYTTEWEFNFVDPFLQEAYAEQQAAVARAEKRTLRQRNKIAAEVSKGHS